MSGKIFNDDKRPHGIDASVPFWCRAGAVVVLASPAITVVVGGVYLIVWIAGGGA